MRIRKTCTLILLLISVSIVLQAQLYKPDPAIVDKIINEGLNNSEIEELSFWLTDYAGPRLTASTGLDRGNEIARKKMEEYGLSKDRKSDG